jgi:hypothetical protein
MDSFSQAQTLTALTKAMGFIPQPLTKAELNPEHFSEELRPVIKLIELARKDFALFGKQMIAEVQKMIDGDRLFPLTDEKVKVLREIFEDYQLKVSIRLTGLPEQAKYLKELRRAGLIEPDVSLLDLSFKVGKVIHNLRLQGTEPGKYPSFETMIERAKVIPITDVEKRAVKFIKQSAAERVRPIAGALTGRINGHILNQEKVIIRKEILTGVKERIHPFDLARQLRETALGENIASSRDYERVARTELNDAYAQGVFSGLASHYRGQDPLVYKIVAKTACKHCKRIWGKSDSPRYYRMSEVAANPSNEGIKAANWQAQVGTIHPNCTEAGLLVKFEEPKK